MCDNTSYIVAISFGTTIAWKDKSAHFTKFAHLHELEQWHAAAQSLADPYSPAETRFIEGFAEPFTENTETNAEMENYAEFHAMKVAVRGDNNDNAAC